MSRLKYVLKRSKKPFPLKWQALYMPGRFEKVFLTKKAAWDWIANHVLCSGCQEEWKNGGCWYEYKGEKLWEETSHPSSTACGCEWWVIDITKDKEDIIYFLRSKKEKERLRKNVQAKIQSKKI